MRIILIADEGYAPDGIHEQAPRVGINIIIPTQDKPKRPKGRAMKTFANGTI